MQIYMEDIRKKCNPMMDLSKFTSNKKILNGVVALIYNQVFFFFEKQSTIKLVVKVCPKCNYVGPKKI